MPPVLHVPLAELAAGGAEKMFAQQAGLGMHEGHRVLQLIAEAERAAGLVESRPRPHAAGERLVDEPAVGQEVDGRVGRFDVDRAERAAPVVPDPFQGPVGVAGAAEALHELPRLLFAAGGAEDEDDFLFLSVLECDRDLHGGAGIEPRADAAGEPNAAQGGGVRRRAVAAEEFRAVAGDGSDRFAAVDKDDPVGKLGVVRVACEERAADRVQLGHHVHERSCRAVRPAPIPSNRSPRVRAAGRSGW